MRTDGAGYQTDETDALAKAPLLECRGVQCGYGGVLAVRGVDLAVHAGERLGLIGANGAGKTTLINAITGNVPIQVGTVHFRGEDVTGKPPDALARRGLIRTFQQSTIFPALSVMENMLLGRRFAAERLVTRSVFQRRAWRAEEADAVRAARGLLQRFGIASHENARASSLSGGQRRLLELARALMSNPTLLVLDEPLAGVSGPMVKLLIDHLLGVSADGVTIMIVEHDMAVIESLCDRVAVMGLGKLIADGPMEKIRADEQVQLSYLG